MPDPAPPAASPGIPLDGPPPTAGLPRIEASPPRDRLPAFQPWPPPAPSGRDVIPRHLLVSAAAARTSLGEVADRLAGALDARGYTDRSWYRVPNGFALATKMEQMRPDGASVAPPARFALTPQRRLFPLSEYLRSVLLPAPGMYRVFVFVVTSDVVVTDGRTQPAREDADRWVRAGGGALDRGTADLELTVDHRMEVLIYQFVSPTDATVPKLVPSQISGRQHLVRAGLWDRLGGS